MYAGKGIAGRGTHCGFHRSELGVDIPRTRRTDHNLDGLAEEAGEAEAEAHRAGVILVNIQVIPRNDCADHERSRYVADEKHQLIEKWTAYIKKKS